MRYGQWGYRDHSGDGLFRHTFRACGTGDLHSRAFRGAHTSQNRVMGVESEAPVAQESSKHETGRHPQGIRLGVTRVKLAWDDGEVGERCGWHFQAKVNQKVISALTAASVTWFCPVPDGCFSLFWSAICMVHWQDNTLSDQGWNGNECFENLCDKITCRLISILHNAGLRHRSAPPPVLSPHASDTRDPVSVQRETQEASVGGRARGGGGTIRVLKPSCCWLKIRCLSV